MVVAWPAARDTLSFKHHLRFRAFRFDSILMLALTLLGASCLDAFLDLLCLHSAQCLFPNLLSPQHPHAHRIGNRPHPFQHLRAIGRVNIEYDISDFRVGAQEFGSDVRPKVGDHRVHLA